MVNFRRYRADAEWRVIETEYYLFHIYTSDDKDEFDLIISGADERYQMICDALCFEENSISVEER